MDELSTSDRITSTTPFSSPSFGASSSVPLQKLNGIFRSKRLATPEVLNDGINNILPNINPTDKAICSTDVVTYFSPYYPRALFCPESKAEKD
jgi:hypothetical protein